MTEESKSSSMNNLIIGIIGSIIGGLIVYYLLKPRITVASLQSNNVENRLENIEQRLNQLQIPQSNQQQSIQSLKTQSLPQQSTSIPLYKNNESWEIIRGKDGFISKLNVLRDVKLNN